MRSVVIGAARSPQDPTMYHRLSLIAFLAWVGLGADGLSSSCYGPPEAFIGLKGHIYLGLFVAMGTALTVIVISASYSQIVELFPSGGGGYVVASKLLTPGLGMLSGCALLIDYVLTISLSIASGAAAIFSLMPPSFQASPHFDTYRLLFAACGVVALTLLNMRGVKDSVVPLVPIFLTFLFTHVIVIVYGMATHVGEVPTVVANTSKQVHEVIGQLGFLGFLFLLIRAYSLGAGTFTGIEAVSNGMLILREPRVKTAKRTMFYMAASLAFMALGLMVTYILYEVKPEAHRTVNAILFDSMTQGWGKGWGYAFVLLALISEGAILFVAAQTGFLDGPRVLANMALDRWFPSRFSVLSDRLVTQNGILLMGGAALAGLILGGASVEFLVVLYAINVFITFVLSQLGMMRHWWQVRCEGIDWLHRFVINGIGFVLTGVILVCVTVVKFHEGGWITLALTGALVTVALWVRRHYNNVAKLLRRLDELVVRPELWGPPAKSGDAPVKKPLIDPKAKTAVILVSGYNGVGLHTLAGVLRLFSGVFKNFVFVQVGVVDAGNFKGAQEMGHLQQHVDEELNRYVDLMQRHGYAADAFSSIGTDVIEEIVQLSPEILAKYPNAMLFGGQLAFPQETMLTRWLHNNAVFAMQRRFYKQGIPFIILPIRV